MKVAAATYRHIINIKDDKFDVHEIANYTLYLQISDSEFDVCVIDMNSKRCLMAEKFTLGAVYSSTQITDQLELIYDDHTTLQAGYWKEVVIGFKNTQFSLIPSSLFSENDLEHYLRLNSPFDPNRENINFIKHKNLELYNAFAYDKHIFNWFCEKYSMRTVSACHQTSAFIEGIHKGANFLNSSKRMYINCDSTKLNIIVTKDTHLEYCNLFEYNTAEDLTYYTMFVIQELGLDPDQIPVTLWGNFDQTSIHFARLFKYIRYLELGKRPNMLKFGYQFDELYDHQFFDLYNIHLCH